MKWNLFKKKSGDYESVSDSFLDEKTQKRRWFEELVDQAIQRQESQEVVRFIIEDVQIKGFKVKTGGLYAFVMFRYMPWQYPDRKMWEAIFPIIAGKTFLGKIYKIDLKRRMCVVVDGNIPQFDELTLNIGEDYTGIVVKKISNHVYIDLGYQFNWDYGSFVGLLHSSTFDSPEQFRACKVGQEIDVKYLKTNKIGQLLLGRCDNPDYGNEENIRFSNLSGDYEH
jgi:hypothetical protein